MGGRFRWGGQPSRSQAARSWGPGTQRLGMWGEKRSLLATPQCPCLARPCGCPALMAKDCPGGGAKHRKVTVSLWVCSPSAPTPVRGLDS